MNETVKYSFRSRQKWLNTLVCERKSCLKGHAETRRFELWANLAYQRRRRSFHRFIPRVEGWIEKSFNKIQIGDSVKKASPYSICNSPTLVNAQEEFVFALARKDKAA